MGRAVFSPCCFAWGKLWWGNYVDGDLQKDLCTHCCIQCLDPAAGHCQPVPLPETPGHSQESLAWTLTEKSGSVSCGDTSPILWLVVCTKLCTLFVQTNMYSKSVSPVLWKFWNKISLASKENSLGVVSPFADPQVGKYVVGPRTFLTVWEFLWFNCPADWGSSAQRLYGGANGDLLQEGLCHTLHDPGLLQPEPLSPRQATADPCLCRRHSDTQRQAWLSLCGVSGSWCAQGFVWTIWASLVGMEFDSKRDFTPPIILLGLLLCPWTWGIHTVEYYSAMERNELSIHSTLGCIATELYWVKIS